MNFRPCADCYECCTGKLIGNQYGNLMFPGKKCVFLVQSECVIHRTRPESCMQFQCAWSQHLFPEWMRPDKSNALVSVEKNQSGEQYLKVVCKGEISNEVQQEIDTFCKTNNCKSIYVRL